MGVHEITFGDTNMETKELVQTFNGHYTSSAICYVLITNFLISNFTELCHFYQSCTDVFPGNNTIELCGCSYTTEAQAKWVW